MQSEYISILIRIVLGIALGVFGYKISQKAINIVMSLVLAGAAYTMCGHFGADSNLTLAITVIAVLTGLAFGNRITTLIIGLSGAAIGYYLVTSIASSYISDTALLIAGMIGAFVVMSLVIRLEKYALRFITSFVASSVVIPAMSSVLPIAGTNAAIGATVLGIVFFILQMIIK